MEDRFEELKLKLIKIIIKATSVSHFPHSAIGELLEKLILTSKKLSRIKLQIYIKGKPS